VACALAVTAVSGAAARMSGMTAKANLRRQRGMWFPQCNQ
jgi:hypothetical protein